MKNKSILIVISVLCAAMLLSCKKESSIEEQVLNNLKSVLAVQDKRCEIYETALNKTMEYIQNPEIVSLQAAKNACIESIRTIAAIENVSSVLDSDVQKQMIQSNIDIMDYSAPFYVQSYYKHNNVQTILTLLYYLNHEPELKEQLKYTVEMNIRMEALDRKTEYFGLNALFAECSGKEMEEFKTEFLPSLKTFSSDGLPWENDKKIIDAKINALFLDMEKEVEEYSLFLGKEYKELLLLQKECEKALLEGGYSKEEAKNFMKELDKLSEDSFTEQQKLLEQQ